MIILRSPLIFTLFKLQNLLTSLLIYGIILVLEIKSSLILKLILYISINLLISSSSKTVYITFLISMAAFLLISNIFYFKAYFISLCSLLSFFYFSGVTSSFLSIGVFLFSVNLFFNSATTISFLIVLVI